MATLILISVFALSLLLAAWLLTRYTIKLQDLCFCDDCCDVFDDDNPDKAVHRESATGDWCKCGCDC